MFFTCILQWYSAVVLCREVVLFRRLFLYMCMMVRNCPSYFVQCKQWYNYTEVAFVQMTLAVCSKVYDLLHCAGT